MSNVFLLDSLGTSLDHWNDDDVWLECGKSDSDIFPESRSGSLDNRVSDVIISFSTGQHLFWKIFNFYYYEKSMQ